MTTGTVTRVISDPGFDFIQCDEGGQDVFFHLSELDRPLKFESLLGGERVAFEVERSQRGPRAVRFRPAL